MTLQRPKWPISDLHSLSSTKSNKIQSYNHFMFQIANSVRHTSLACLAARVVRSEGLDTSPLPATLRTFVTSH